MENKKNDSDPFTFDEDFIKRADKLFSGSCDFVAGAAQEWMLPNLNLPEVAFIGRSNVGKSSLINALTNRKALAKTSQTPGRTQQINFFQLSDKMHLVDLPGYGYAKASKQSIATWTKLIDRYLKGRVQLVRSFVLIDARHGLKQNDIEVLKELDEAAVSYQVILTKTDKITETAALITSIEEKLQNHPAAFPKVVATSATTKAGITSLRSFILNCVEN
jgi:GTP-binding protein